MGRSKDLATGETRFANVSGDTFTDTITIKKAHGAAYGSFAPLIELNGHYPGYDETAVRGYIEGGVPDQGNTTYGSFGVSLKGADGMQRRLAIDSVGRVTMPNQPAFRAWKDTASWSLNGGDTFIFDRTIYNTGSHYSTSTGRFTAPVAGVYHFNFYSIQLGSLNNAQIKVYVNNTRIKGGDVHFSPNSGNFWDFVAWNGDLYLNASDYVHVLSPSSMTYHGNNWSGFTGHLVG